MTTVTVQPRARLDILEQAEYYADHSGIELAFRFQESADASFSLLAIYPRMGKPSRLRHDSLRDVREFPVRDFEMHLIFYRPRLDGIDVLRVIHGARDIKTLLDEEPI